MAKVGIVWCSAFAGPWWSRSWRLPCAYRPPSLFAAKMRTHGHDVIVLNCDEKLELSHLDGTLARLHDDVDILYVMTHGQFGTGGYAAELNVAQWFPNGTGLAGSNLKVAIFDTCNLLDRSQNWQALWQANLGKSLRVILGFEGTVAIDWGSALRGAAFAEELIGNNLSFADAWLTAAHNSITYAPAYKRAVAIGLGDTAADASAVLASASLASLPAARTVAVPALHLKP